MVDRQHLESVFRDMSNEFVRKKKTRNRSNFSPIPLNQVNPPQLTCPTLSNEHRQQQCSSSSSSSSSSCISHEHLGIHCANDLPYYQDDWKRSTSSLDQMHYRQQKYSLSPNLTNNNHTYAAARRGVNSFSKSLCGHQGEVEQLTSMRPPLVPTFTELKNLPVVKEEEQKLCKIRMEDIESYQAYENAFDLLASFMGERTETVIAQPSTSFSSFALPTNSNYVANTSLSPEEGVPQSSLGIVSPRKMIPGNHFLLASPDMTSGGPQRSAITFTQPSSSFFDDRVGVEESTCSKMGVDAKYGHSRNATCSKVPFIEGSSMVPFAGQRQQKGVGGVEAVCTFASCSALSDRTECLSCDGFGEIAQNRIHENLNEMFRRRQTANVQQFFISKNWLNAQIHLASDWVAFEILGCL